MIVLRIDAREIHSLKMSIYLQTENANDKMLIQNRIDWVVGLLLIVPLRRTDKYFFIAGKLQESLCTI